VENATMALSPGPENLFYLAKTFFVAFLSRTNLWQLGYVQGAQFASSQVFPICWYLLFHPSIFWGISSLP
jgi:hypothetical protein